MNKKFIYSIIIIALLYSFGFMYQNIKATTTFNLVNQEVDYKQFAQNWLKEHQRIVDECPIEPVGQNVDNIQREYVKLKEVRKVLESYIYDETLVPKEYKELHTKLQDSVINCLYGVDQLMDGLLHSDSKLIKSGKDALRESYAKIAEVKKELEKVD